MATEAEIIPEPISVLKAEEEITKPIPELKKSEAGLDMPAGTDECLDKANNVELASNGVQTLSTVSDSKTECFSVSPEVPKVTEKTSEVIADRDSSPEEERVTIEEDIGQNAIESNKQEGNLELTKQDLITNPDPIDSSNETNEVVTGGGHSDIVQEKLEEKNLEEIKDTEPEKLPILEGKEGGTEATDPIETSTSEKDQIISNSIEDILTSKAAETSDIKDHGTTKEISEVAEKELQNESPQEAACIHEPAAEVHEKLEEVSKEPETERPIADISNLSVSKETVKESTKEDESIPLELTEKANSSLELEESKKDTEQDEQSSDLGLEKEKIEDVKLLDKATDVEKVIQEEEEIHETEVPEGAHDQILEVININDETIPEYSKSQVDEPIPDVQQEESEKKINGEPEEKPEDEQNANEVTKVVILSEEVKDNSSVSNECLKEGDSKEHVEAKNTEAEECSTEDREASLIVESEKLASEPEVKEVDETKAVPTELASELEVNEVEETKAVPRELALELEVKEVEDTKVVATKLASEPEMKEAEEAKDMPTELASEPKLNVVEEIKAVATKSASEPEVNVVEEIKAVATESASEPEVNVVEQTKAVATELASEPELNEVEQTKAVTKESASELEVNEVEQIKAVASELEVNEVEQTKAVATELASEPEMNEVEEIKTVPTESAPEPEVKEVQETKAVPTELVSEPEVYEVEETKAVPTELVSEPEVYEVEETKAVPTESASEPEVKEVEETKAVPTELASEVKEVEETKAVPTELFSEPEVYGVEETKAVPTESATEPEVKNVEETKAVPTKLASEPEVKEVEETKAVPTELASEPEVNEVEQTKVVPTELASEPEVKEVEETKAVPTESAPEPEVKEVEETKAVPTESSPEPEVKEVKETKAAPTELASEPEVNEVQQTKVVLTELASEPEVTEVEQTKDVPTESVSEPEVNEVEQAKTVTTELAPEPEVDEVEQTTGVPAELVSEPEVNEVEQTKSVPKTSSEYLSQSVLTPTATLPSKDEEIETAQSIEKIEEIHKDAGIVKHDSTTEEVCLRKEESEPKAVSVEETIIDEGLQNEDSEAKQTTEICLEKEHIDEVEDGKKDETAVARAIEVEIPKDESLVSELPEAVVDHESTAAQASITEESKEMETSALPSEKQEKLETELQKDESPEKIEEQTTEVEAALKAEVETSAKAFDNGSIKDEVLEVKEVTETSHSTLEPEEPAKDGYVEDEPKDKVIEYRSLETTQTEEAVVEAPEVKETEIIDKQMVCEDKTVEKPSQASSKMPIEEEPSLELSQTDPEGIKASDNQISRELESIENTEITSSIVKAEVEDVKEVSPKEAEVGEKIKDKSGEDITESTPMEDSTKLTVETVKADANNNVAKEIVAEDQTVKEQEQPQVATKEATIVPGEVKVIDNGEEKTDNSGVETKPEPAPATSGNISLSDLLQRSEEEKTEVAERVIEERELTISKEAAAPAKDAENIQAKEAKTDEVPEGDEHNKTDSGSDAPVMVEAPRDTETKPHKKSQNIVSKAISKVKKVITGKSSNSKEPKAISPKGGEK